jgi:nitric oxide reductase subunit B
MVAALVYTDAEPAILRGIHEAAAFAWMFLGGSAIVYFYLFSEHGAPSRAETTRMATHLALWAVAGAGIVVTLGSGSFTGREYAPYHPVFSVMILTGWMLFAWNVLGRTGGRLRGMPVYVYMWTVSLFLFVVTFTEAHLYLTNWLSDRPIRDLQIQWRANGTMVGAFNQMIYGGVMYLGCRMAGDEDYPHSRLAWMLFCVGVINTFTNYGHHTFHLPQSAWVHWVAFLISMAEVVILAKVCLDILQLLKRPARGEGLQVPDAFLRSTTWWIFALLAMALLISVPPVNALIHGTHVVVAHSMASMIGIDSMILWLGASYILYTALGSDHPVVTGASMRRAVPVINVSLFVFWIAFIVHGLAVGWSRYASPSAVDFSLVLKYFPIAMAASGFLMAFAILWMIGRWTVALHTEGVRTPTA